MRSFRSEAAMKPLPEGDGGILWSAQPNVVRFVRQSNDVRRGSQTEFWRGELANGNGIGRPPLTRERICEAALEAIDHAGLETLSMRGLAAALGVKASSLYYHFNSKEELLTGVADFLYRKLGRPPDEGDWAEQVKGTFMQLHDFVQDHPNAAPLLLRDLAYSPVAKKRANVLLRILWRAGLDPEVGATLIGNLVAFLVGHTLLGIWAAQDGVEGSREGVQAMESDPGPRPWVHRVLAPVAVGAQSEGDSGAGGESSDAVPATPSVE